MATAANATDNLAGPSWYPAFKEAADMALAVVLLVLTGPLILGLMALVRLTSEGTGLYAQVRLGRDGRRYMIYKIRTMSHNCEAKSGPQWSTTGDPRITALGRWLRKTHLDELPQLWNVLRGDMSLVGPRPERPEFVQQLEQVIPNYRTRLAVRPGITGLAQVQLPPDEDFAGVSRKVACDAVYVELMGPWLDLRIVVGTAMKIAGAPFEVTRRLLALPGVSLPSPAAEEAVDAEEEAVARLQTA